MEAYINALIARIVKGEIQIADLPVSVQTQVTDAIQKQADADTP